jgi:hypothetical protein
LENQVLGVRLCSRIVFLDLSRKLFQSTHGRLFVLAEILGWRQIALYFSMGN